MKMNLDCFFVINLFIQLVSSSHLTVFLDHPKLLNTSDVNVQPQSHEITCVTDRQRDAIAWNTDVNWSNYNINKFKLTELPGIAINREKPSLQKCRLDVDSKWCFSLWSQKGGNWSIVRSFDVPMGPVYDNRWEVSLVVSSCTKSKFWKIKDFVDFENEKFKTIKTMKSKANSILTFGETGSVTFSIRGPANAQIIICESEKYETDFCYWIIIGGWDNHLSVIRKCETGISWWIPPINSPCYFFQSEHKHRPLNISIWKTFVLTWKEKTRTIELFDPDKKILSYSDHNSTYRNSNKLYYILYGNSNENLRFRFHDYSYTLTTNRGAILQSSPLVLGNSQELCIDMMVGLCKHCEVIVNMVDGSGKRRVTKTIRRSLKYDSIEHDLPMWQNNIIKEMNISDYPSPVTLELEASVSLKDSDTTKHHWAITQFRHCLPEGTMRSTKLNIYSDSYPFNYPTSYGVFQRLSYDSESEVVYPSDELSTNSNDFENCLNYNIGPNCAIKCDSFFQHDCHGVHVCTKNGCLCAQGWQGPNCATKCSAGSYGFGCSKNCSNCIDDNCDSYTGKCYRGCKSTTAQFRVPPYCNIVIERPSKPFIDELTSTSARVSVYEEFHETATVTLEFEAKTKSGDILKKYAKKTLVSFNGTEKTLYYAIFDGLSPGEQYSVKTIIYIELEDNKIKQIIGSSATFLTPCNWSKKFEITPGERRLLIKKVSTEKETYSCGDSWYSIDLSIIIPTINTSFPVNINNTETKFPITLSELYPFTKYQICINVKDNQFRICQISSTLEAAPSPVANFQVKSITSTKAELIWSSPELPNGILKGYNLTIKVLYYVGCENEKNTPEYLKTTKDYPNITPTTTVSYNLTDLVPYVTYEVTVIAFNSKIGNKSSLIFSTKPPDIPTEVFTNISFSHNNLTWDNSADCWTITGPIEFSRVIITGVSENVKDFFYSHDIRSHFLNLKTLKIYGNEKYYSKVYVLHKSINMSAYIDIFFTTEPSPPPKIRKLEIIEIDKSMTTLRWQQPLSPTNGQLNYFSIRFLRKNGTLLKGVKVYLNETCYLWKNSFCKTVLHPSHGIEGFIEVRAHNKGVNDPGESFIIDDDRREHVPEEPEIISITEVDKGVVYLKWKHPSITGGLMKKFMILSEILDTELEHIPSQKVQNKVVPIKKYEPKYSIYLYLLPSTRYRIIIQGVTSTQIGKPSTKMIETNRAWNFQYEPRLILDNDTFLINIVIPPVINNIKDSQLHIIVKGPSMCKQGGKLTMQMMKDIQVDNHELARRVATFPTYRTSNLLFTIGDNYIYDTVTNCPLNIGSSYVIVLLVYEKVHLKMNKITRPLIWQSKSIQVGEISNIHHASWAIPFVLAILCIAVTMYYCSRRRRNTNYFNKKRCRGITEPVLIHPITVEKKNSPSLNCTQLTYLTTATEHVYEEVLNTIDGQGSILKALPNSSDQINRINATESKYDDVSSMIDGSNSSDRINRTVITEPTYLELIDTID